MAGFGLYNNVPLKYVGVPFSLVSFITRPFPPTVNDWQNFSLGCIWLNQKTKAVYILVSLNGNQAIWAPFAGPSGDVQTLTGDDSIVVSPSAGNINIISGLSTINSGSSVSVTGNNSTATLTLNVTDSNSNTLIGFNAGNASIAGNHNTGLGVNALSGLTSANFNLGLGSQALRSVTSGNYNTSINANLVGITTGTGNLAIGIGAGNNYATGTESNNIIIGANGGVNGESGVIRIGGGSQTSAYIAGVSGVTVSNENLVTINTVTGQLGSASAGLVNFTYTNVTDAMSPYTVLSTDEYISVNCTVGSVTLKFPNAATTGRGYVIKDRTGNAGTNNITLQSVSGAVNIDAATTFVMNTNYESVNLLGNSTSYEVW